MSSGLSKRTCFWSVNRGGNNLVNGVPAETRTRNLLPRRQSCEAKLLNKLTVSELTELSNLSKAYISQVKNGKRKPSKKLLESLTKHTRYSEPSTDYISLFLKSRESMGVSPRTLEFYEDRLGKFSDYGQLFEMHTERH